MSTVSKQLIAIILYVAMPVVSACSLDIDNNGQQDALTDGLLLIRQQFGLTGTALTQNALGLNAQRTDPADIVDYINSDACQAYFDVDGSQTADALTRNMSTSYGQFID